MMKSSVDEVGAGVNQEAKHPQMCVLHCTLKALD
jgi:hypothetical protein